MTSALAYLLFACAIAVLVLWRLRRTSKARFPLPPSPPADPVIGHLRIFSPTRQLELFSEWAAKYGDIFHLGILGQNLIILNSLDVATDLLDKRSSIYSGRPTCTMFEMMGWDASLSLMQYGPRWKKHRKMFQEYFSQSASLTYCTTQARAARSLLKNLLMSPESFTSSTQRYTLRSTIGIAYGHHVESDDDMYLKLASGALHGVELGTLGVSLVDLFPSLKYIPHWLPGFSSLTANPRRYRPVTRRLHDYSLEETKKRMYAGNAQPSFLVTHLEQLDMASVSGEDVDDITGAAATILIGGMETTWSLLRTFFLAMVLHPAVQHKAQEEIDRVIGSERLPELSDRGSLTFVECVLQEVIRWHPVTPAGVAHKSLQDDVYNGMFIPKGSILMPHVMAMSRDANFYKDAESFYPERFLPAPAGRGEPHLSVAFGFGRRICPGRYFANNSAWLAVAMVLATLNVNKVVGQDGNVIEPKADFTTEGVTSCPRPFQCVVRPRSDAAKVLILQHAD